jgi:UrcA family protein
MRLVVRRAGSVARRQALPLVEASRAAVELEMPEHAPAGTRPPSSRPAPSSSRLIHARRPEMMKTVLFAAAAALATVATATPVLAKNVVVSYADLDLTSAKGQHDLARRIDRAAKRACDYHQDGHIAARETMNCYRQARSRANTEMALLVENKNLGG